MSTSTSTRTLADAGRPKPPADTARIMALLFQQHPNAFTELDFRNPFELLVATILSAQSTDKGVNMVTPVLFEKYPDAAALASADVPEVERIVKTTGFFRQKAKAIMGMASALVSEHGGAVPADMDQLTALPGVGRKTANVVRGHALGVPGMPVDRHVLRVANRIGIAHAATPEEVETQLCAAMPREQWTLTSDTLILHGRRICRPHPLCEQCAVVSLCDFAREWNRTGDAAEAGAASSLGATGRGAKRAKSGAFPAMGRNAAKSKTAAGSNTRTANATETAKAVKPAKTAKPAKAAKPAAARTAKAASGTAAKAGARASARAGQTGRARKAEAAMPAPRLVQTKAKKAR